MRVIFPADYFKSLLPDEMYAEQAAAFSRLGWAVSTFAFEGDRKFRPALEAGDLILYRGWMLDSAEYAAFEESVQAAGGRMFTPTDAYLNAHHLPRWAPLLTDLTPETVCFEELSDIESNLRTLAWDRFFIKDFVKSLKTGGGSLIDRPEQISALMAEMEQFRGKIEGGICARKFEAFVPESEQRYFVLDGIASAANGSLPPQVVQECAERIQSRFYSVDVAKREDGVLRVVEIGDGQVSDLVGWSVAAFMALWTNNHPLES